MGEPADLVLTAPIFDRSGFADEVRTVAIALDRAGIAVHVNPMFWTGWTTPLSTGAAERIRSGHRRFRVAGLKAPQWQPVALVQKDDFFGRETYLAARVNELRGIAEEQLRKERQPA